MKRFFLVLLLLLSPLTANAQSLVTYTFNLQHGEGTDGVTDYARQVASIADGDLIAVQERTTGDNGWNTPRASAGIAEAVCRENDSSQGDGPCVWYKTATVGAPVDTYQVDLSEGFIGGASGSPNVDKAAVGAQFSVNGRTLYFFSTHFCWSACADSEGSTSSTQRIAQITTFLAWVSGIVGSNSNAIIGLDANFGSDYPGQATLFTASYSDLWLTGITQSTATANWGDRNSDAIPDMPVTDLTTRTHDTRRIDRIYLKIGAGFTLTSISVPDGRATCPHALVAGGVLPSCSPEVVGGPTVSGQQWDIEDDFGVKDSDHNRVRAVLTFSEGRINGKVTMVGKVAVN